MTATRLTLAAAILGALAGAGCSRRGADTAIVVGVPTALGTIEGQDALRAVQLAAAELNEAGGVEVKGTRRKLEVVSIDTREAEAGVPVNEALAAMEKLVSERKPAAIVVGAFRSEVLLAAMDLNAKFKVPYLCTIGMSGEFEKKVASDPARYRYNFRLGLSAPYLVGNIGKTIDFIQSKFSFDKIYFVHQDVAWAKGTAGALARAAAARGWKVVGSDAYPTGARDFSSSLAKVKAAGAQVIVPVFDMPESGVLVKQARTMKVNALLTGIIGPAASASSWNTFHGEIDGLVNFMMEAGPIPLRTPRSQAFYQGYARLHGEAAVQNISGHGTAPAYDAVHALAEAIRRAGSTDPDAVVAQLERTDMEGAIGRVAFNKEHQVIYGDDPKQAACTLAFQWRAGKRLVVFPVSAAEAQIELPGS